jgi:hypothetical protein
MVEMSFMAASATATPNSSAVAYRPAGSVAIARMTVSATVAEGIASVATSATETEPL